MTKIMVGFEFDENELGPKWFNIDNLRLLLYCEIATKPELLEITSFVEVDEDKCCSNPEISWNRAGTESMCFNCGVHSSPIT